MKNSDHFPQDFVKANQEHDELKDSLKVQLLHLTLSKMNGHENPKTSPKVMKFFVACKDSPRKTFDLVCSNLLGLCLQSI